MGIHQLPRVREARVSDVMSTDVVTVGPEDSLRRVVETLSEHGLSGAPVVTGTDRVVGVVSATDILDFQAATPGVPVETGDTPEWGESESGPGREDIDAAPGPFFLDLWAERGPDSVDRFRHVEGPEWDVLDDHTASEIMTHRVYALPPDAELREAARIMVEAGIHRILVTEDDRLQGIVTTMDVVRAVATSGVRIERPAVP